MKTEAAKVIILGGQSNATGHAFAKFLKGRIPDEKYKLYENGFDRILISYADNPLYYPNVSEEFVPVRFGQGVEKETSFGPEIGIADYLSGRFPGEAFYIIKCATSGSSLCGGWNPSARGDLFDHFTGFAGKALERLGSAGVKPKLTAFCWMQGESDAATTGTALGYNALFGELIEKTARSLAPEGGDFAVIQAGVKTPEKSFYELVNEQKKEYTAQKPNRYYFDTDDLQTDGDNDDTAHYDALPMLTLGARFAEKIAEYTEKL